MYLGPRRIIIIVFIPEKTQNASAVYWIYFPYWSPIIHRFLEELWTVKPPLTPEERLGYQVERWLTPLGSLKILANGPTTPNIVGPKMLRVVASVCTWLYDLVYLSSKVSATGSPSVPALDSVFRGHLVYGYCLNPNERKPLININKHRLNVLLNPNPPIVTLGLPVVDTTWFDTFITSE